MALDERIPNNDRNGRDEDRSAPRAQRTRYEQNQTRQLETRRRRKCVHHPVFASSTRKLDAASSAWVQANSRHWKTVFRIQQWILVRHLGASTSAGVELAANPHARLGRVRTLQTAGEDATGRKKSLQPVRVDVVANSRPPRRCSRRLAHRTAFQSVETNGRSIRTSCLAIRQESARTRKKGCTHSVRKTQALTRNACDVVRNACQKIGTGTLCVLATRIFRPCLTRVAFTYKCFAIWPHSFAMVAVDLARYPDRHRWAASLPRSGSVR